MVISLDKIKIKKSDTIRCRTKSGYEICTPSQAQLYLVLKICGAGFRRFRRARKLWVDASLWTHVLSLPKRDTAGQGLTGPPEYPFIAGGPITSSRGS